MEVRLKHMNGQFAITPLEDGRFEIRLNLGKNPVTFTASKEKLREAIRKAEAALAMQP